MVTYLLQSKLKYTSIILLTAVIRNPQVLNRGMDDVVEFKFDIGLVTYSLPIIIKINLISCYLLSF